MSNAELEIKSLKSEIESLKEKNRLLYTHTFNVPVNFLQGMYECDMNFQTGGFKYTFKLILSVKSEGLTVNFIYKNGSHTACDCSGTTIHILANDAKIISGSVGTVCNLKLGDGKSWHPFFCLWTDPKVSACVKDSMFNLQVNLVIAPPLSTRCQVSLVKV